MKTFWLKYRMRVMSRYLFPPMLNTTQVPTMLAVAKSAFTSDQDFYCTDLSLTRVYQARNGPSESSRLSFGRSRGGS
jgi:hypothetical protein